MKRSQGREGNCGHWEFEDRHPESRAQEQSSVPRSPGTTTTRRLRVLRSTSRDFAAGMTLVGMACRVDETWNTLQRARLEALAALVATENRMVSSTSVGVNEILSESHRSDGIAIGMTEDPMFAVHEDPVQGSAPCAVDGLSDAIASVPSQEPPSVAQTGEPHQDYCPNDRGKENEDPRGDNCVSAHRSPLPEWFPRMPLQDITNVLAGCLDDEQPQPKKKRNKKVVTTPVQALLSVRNIPVQCAQTRTLPESISCATPKHAYNLRKNFR